MKVREDETKDPLFNIAKLPEKALVALGLLTHNSTTSEKCVQAIGYCEVNFIFVWDFFFLNPKYHDDIYLSDLFQTSLIKKKSHILNY